MIPIEERRAQAVEESRRRHLARGRIDVNTNFGSFRLEAKDHARDRDITGIPRWETDVGWAAGPTFFAGHFDDRALREIADLIYRYLGIPQAPVRVEVVVAVAPSPPRRRRKADK